MENIRQLGSLNIPKDIIEQGIRLSELPCINLSFSKGKIDRFLTLSGIVREDRKAFHTRVSYKADPPTFKSYCDCPYWNETEHCHHALALLQAHLSRKEIAAQISNESSPETMFAHLTHTKKGTHPREFGHIVFNYRDLPGAAPRSDFLYGHYILTNGKIQPLPNRKSSGAQIWVNLKSANQSSLFKFQPGIEHSFFPEFTLVDPQGKQRKKISLFFEIGAFCWESGDIFEVDPQVWKMMKFYQSTPLLRLEEHWPLLHSLKDFLTLNSKKLNEIKINPTHFEFHVKHAKDESLSSFQLRLLDEENTIYGLPNYIKLISNTRGWLEKFSKRKSAHQFIRKLDHFSNPFIADLPQESQKRINYEFEQFETMESSLCLSTDSSECSFVPHHNLKQIVIHIASALEQHLLRSTLHSQNYWSLQVPKSETLDILAKLVDHLGSLGVKFYYNNSTFKYWNPQVRFSRDKSNLDWFNLQVDIDGEDIEAIKQYNPNKNYLYHRGELLFLNSENKQLYSFLKRALGKGSKFEQTSAQGLQVTYHRSQIFELLEFYKLGHTDLLTPEELKICERLENLSELPEYDTPEMFEHTPRHYQSLGYKWIRFLYECKFGACLADDMGLGKTFQTILFVKSVFKDLNRVLIVCPVSIISNWEREFKDFSGLTPFVYYGPLREKPSPQEKIIITSYGLLKREIDTTFSELEFDIAAFDEIQHLKNPSSNGAKAARKLKVKFRLALTGTPVENDLSEFYNILDLAVPGVWGHNIAPSSYKNKKDLAKKYAKPFILRRTKKQVLTELPDKIETHVFLEFTDQERLNYNNTLKNIQDEIINATKGDLSVLALKNLLKLRQLCLWQQQRESVQSTKIEYLLESLEQLVEEGHKVLIFSQFTRYLDQIQKNVVKKGWLYSRIDGSYTLKRREDQIEKFQNGPNSLFLISLKAGGLGLNLTEANYIFLMDPWWNPAVENQAIDRAHRIGQTRTLNVYRPIIKNSVEEKVMELQKRKKELFDELLGDHESSQFTGKLTSQDFKYLLNIDGNNE